MQKCSKVGLMSGLTALTLIFTTPLLSAETCNETIKIIKNNWTSQLVLSEIAGDLIEKLGCKVAYIEMDVAKQWGALARNEAHIQMEVWEGTMATDFNKMVSKGVIIDGGSYSATTREEWWVNQYALEQCPGLPNWEALKNCAKAFSEPDSNGLGVYVSGPWEKPDAVKIRSLGIPFKVRQVKDGDQLWVELEKADKAKKAIALFNWSPNWVEAVYKGAFVEFPKYAPECEKDPKWGTNPNDIYDCGNPAGGWLKKGMSQNANKNPKISKLIKSITFDNHTIAEFAKAVDYDKKKVSDIAKEWMKANEATWKPWVN